jgi:membrane protease YdiL (CAAX protease family)
LPLGQVALVFVAMFFVFVFVSVTALLLFGNEIGRVVGELSVLVVPLIYLMSKNVDTKKYVKICLTPKSLLIGLTCGLLLLVLNLLFTLALTAILGESSAVQRANQRYVAMAASPLGLSAVVTSLILAGICEEFAFRGFLQNSIFKTLKKSKSANFAFVVAVAVASTIFGLFHFDIQGVYILSALATGLFLGYFYHRWNYTVSATAHATMNVLLLTLLLW